MTCFSLELKNEHLNVRVNLDLGMRKDVSGLRHMLLVARGFFQVVFALLFCNLFSIAYFIHNIIFLRFQVNKILNWNLIYNYINVFYNLANLKLNFICSWFYNFSFYYSSQLNFTTNICKIVTISLIWLYIYITIIFLFFIF